VLVINAARPVLHKWQLTEKTENFEENKKIACPVKEARYLKTTTAILSPFQFGRQRCFPHYRRSFS
jgi:hypothetical protein